MANRNIAERLKHLYATHQHTTNEIYEKHQIQKWLPAPGSLFRYHDLYEW